MVYMLYIYIYTLHEEAGIKQSTKRPEFFWQVCRVCKSQNWISLWKLHLYTQSQVRTSNSQTESKLHIMMVWEKSLEVPWPKYPVVIPSKFFPPSTFWNWTIPAHHTLLLLGTSLFSHVSLYISDQPKKQIDLQPKHGNPLTEFTSNAFDLRGCERQVSGLYFISRLNVGISESRMHLVKFPLPAKNSTISKSSSKLEKWDGPKWRKGETLLHACVENVENCWFLDSIYIGIAFYSRMLAHLWHSLIPKTNCEKDQSEMNWSEVNLTKQTCGTFAFINLYIYTPYCKDPDRWTNSWCIYS